jgi:fructose-bisphosphate aldolase class 1
VGTSHKAPGVKSKTGYLAIEQRKHNSSKRFHLVGLESTLKGDTTEKEILLRSSSSIVRTRRTTTVAAIARRPATNVETKT